MAQSIRILCHIKQKCRAAVIKKTDSKKQHIYAIIKQERKGKRKAWSKKTAIILQRYYIVNIL